MPGRLLILTSNKAIGWAVHPRLTEYRVLVNVVHRSTIVHSVIADTKLTGGETKATPIGCGFNIDPGRLDVAPQEVSRLRFSIGETDEWIDRPDGWTQDETRLMTVEDIMVEAHTRRPWVTGATYLDAAVAGLRAETIIDLLYRDYLGRPSDPGGLTHYTKAVGAGTSTYDDIRRGFIEADEFRLRRKYIGNAPGSIFSQKIVMAAAGEDRDTDPSPPAVARTVSARDLIRLDGAAFVTELYRRVLLKEPDEGGMAHYLHQLHLGVGKVAIIRKIAGELEAITAGIRVIDHPDDAPVAITEPAE